MKRTILLSVVTAFLVMGCTRGKACLCEKFDRMTGEYEGTKYTEDFETCTGASFVLSNEDERFDYDCYDYYQNSTNYYE